MQNKPNEIDLMIVGDGIEFAEMLAEKEERKDFEIHRIKTDVLIAELLSKKS